MEFALCALCVCEPGGFFCFFNVRTCIRKGGRIGLGEWDRGKKYVLFQPSLCGGAFVRWQIRAIDGFEVKGAMGPVRIDKSCIWW
jgi:hypothetical protein